MRRTLWIATCALLIVLPQVTTASPEGAGTAATVDMRFKAYRTWKIHLPAERFERVAGRFDLTDGGGGTFQATLEGSALAVDLDADGTADAKVEGDDGFVTLEAGGYRYAARLVRAADGWRFAASGAMVGKLGDVKIRLIDQNNNGSYADVGEDALIVGTSDFASFLSRVVNVAGTLYTIEVAVDGSRILATPYEGEAGTLDLASGCETKAKLRTAVVRSEDGQLSFDVARASRGLRVPVGTYEIHSGVLGLGEGAVRFRKGRATELTVAAGETTALAWGGPLRAEFAYRRVGDEIGFDPSALWYFGRGGEEYYGWTPFGKSPEFTVVNAKTKEEIAKAIFTGC